MLFGALCKLVPKGVSIQSIRNSGDEIYSKWSYRCPPWAPMRYFYLTWFFGGCVLTRILYGFYVEPEHVFGEDYDIDFTKWTDEQLGIPPCPEVEE